MQSSQKWDKTGWRPGGGHLGSDKLPRCSALSDSLKLQVTIVAYTMNLAQRNKKKQKIYQKTKIFAK